MVSGLILALGRLPSSRPSPGGSGSRKPSPLGRGFGEGLDNGANSGAERLQDAVGLGLCVGHRLRRRLGARQGGLDIVG